MWFSGTVNATGVVQRIRAKIAAMRSAVLFCLLSATLAGAQSALSSNLEKDLRERFEKRVLLIRHFYEGPLLRYDDSLKAIRAPEGTWTVSGYVQIKKIQVKDGGVVIEGRRLAAIYDEKQHNMRLVRYDEPVIIKLTARSDDDARKKVAQIFVGNSDDIVALVPSYWRHYAETHEIADLSKGPKQPLGAPPESHNGVYRVGGEVSPPRPTYHPESSFTEFARRFHIQGHTAVSLTVDENGEPQDISIVKPLGAGLDEAAVQAVKQWRFEPGRKLGQPVKVRVVIEVSYSL